MNELLGIRKGHRIYAQYSCRPAKQRTFFSENLLFNKGHGAAAQNDHDIAVLQHVIPCVLQD